MLFAYDGKIKVKVNRHANYYAVDDFSNNRWPYRIVYAPFMSRVKAVIKYALNSNDSISIVSTNIGNNKKYKISIYDKRIDFVRFTENR